MIVWITRYVSTYFFRLSRTICSARWPDQSFSGHSWRTRLTESNGSRILRRFFQRQVGLVRLCTEQRSRHWTTVLTQRCPISTALRTDWIFPYEALARRGPTSGRFTTVSERRRPQRNEAKRRSPPRGNR